MKTNLRQILALTLTLAAFTLPLSAMAADGQDPATTEAPATGSNATGTLSPKSNPRSVTDCTSCDAARAAGSVGGTIAETPDKYTPSNAAAGKGGSGNTAQ